MNRTLFNKPIRQETTAWIYPHRINLAAFHEFVKDNIDGFQTNIQKLGSPATDEKFIEQWFEMFMAWSEVETE